jgi:hypothetical protein
MDFGLQWVKIRTLSYQLEVVQVGVTVKKRLDHYSMPFY